MHDLITFSIVFTNTNERERKREYIYILSEYTIMKSLFVFFLFRGVKITSASVRRAGPDATVKEVSTL